MAEDSSRSHTDEGYWRDYDGLQAVKHRILGRYLDAWFAKLSTFRGQLLYLDCHAGRGRHETGDPGSPILVLRRLLRHRFRETIFERVQVTCHLFELEERNARRLVQEIERLGPLPDRLHVHVHPADYEEALSRTLDELERSGAELPPSFAFVDPYGFKLSMEFLNRLLNAGRTETLINFMYRYIDMAMTRPSMKPILDRLFGTPEWSGLPSIADSDERFTETVKLFSRRLSADYVSWLVMRGDSGEVKYVLFHATNSVEGRRVMKEAIWATLPDGSYTAYERDRPEQGVLITTRRVPLGELRRLLEDCCGGQTVRLVEDLYPVVDGSPYRHVHLHELLRREVRRGTVRNLDEPGRFIVKRNPRLEIPEEFPVSVDRGHDGEGQRDLFNKRG